MASPNPVDTGSSSDGRLNSHPSSSDTDLSSDADEILDLLLNPDRAATAESDSEGERIEVYGSDSEMSAAESDEEEADPDSDSADPIDEIEPAPAGESLDTHVIRTQPFKRVVRELARDLAVRADLAFEPAAVDALQAAAEAYLVDLFGAASYLAAKIELEDVVRPKHFAAVRKIRGEGV